MTNRNVSVAWTVVGAAGLLLASAAACSSASTSPAAGDEAGAPGEDGGGSGPDGSGAGGDGGGTVGDGGTGDGGSGKTYSGFVAITQDDEMGTFSGGVGAQFTRYLGSAPDPQTSGCIVDVSGPCTFSDCTAAINNPSDAGAGVFPLAGTMNVNGGKLGNIPLTVHDLGDGVRVYASGDLMSAQLFAPGDVFTVTASGADVAAFTGTSAPAPSDIVLTTPVGVADLGSLSYTIDESKDLPISWTGGSKGAKVDVGFNTHSGALTVECTFDAAGGSGTVPSSLLSKLGPAKGVLGADGFFVRPRSEAKLDVSNADVVFKVEGTQVGGQLKTL